MKYFYFYLLMIYTLSCKENIKADEVLMKQIQGSWTSKLAVFNAPIYLFKNDSLYDSNGFYDGYYETYGNNYNKKFIPTKY